MPIAPETKLGKYSRYEDVIQLSKCVGMSKVASCVHVSHWLVQALLFCAVFAAVGTFRFVYVLPMRCALLGDVGKMEAVQKKQLCDFASPS